MNIADFISNFETVVDIISLISLCLFFCMPVFAIFGFFATKKFPKAKKNHKYAIMIAARNEETVIGNLIDSINNQDYPKELIDVFVVADNCSDKTAEISRKYGAVCYERFDNEHKTKGYALEFLVDNIEKDYGTQNYEAFFIFDADNLLKKDYIARMNEAFDSGEKIVTSYRNTKNFSDNWISASYALHWIRTVRFEHRPRALLGLATRIQGTGFMFSSEIIKDGWHYVSFTEDRAFAADAVVNGYRISYQDKAQFYDEQPTSLKIAMRQRIRWGKGHLQAFVESGPKLFFHTFFKAKKVVSYDNINIENEKLTDDTALDVLNMSKDVFKKVIKLKKLKHILLIPFKIILLPFVLLLSLISYIAFGLSVFFNFICLKLTHKKGYKKFISSKAFKGFKLRLMSYDMFTITYPNNLVSILTLIVGLILNIILCIVSPDVTYITPLKFFLVSFLSGYLANIILGVYVFIVERKNIVPMSIFKKIFYSLMWPMFDVIGSVTVLIALFTKVEWKAIPHSANITISDITKEE